jgi:hypothetical protein
MKLKNKSPLETLDIISWLINNVGEQMPGYSTGLRGYGWSVHFNLLTECYDIYLEDDLVDEETQTLFALTCA